MSDTPKFTVVDRRKFRADEDAAPSAESASKSATSGNEPVASEKGSTGPRLTLVEPTGNAAKVEEGLSPVAVAEMPALTEDEATEQRLAEPEFDEPQLPPAPSAEESSFQKAAYDKAAERLEDLVRAQNPAAPPTEKIGFEHLVQQLYLSAMMQMGAGTPEGQRPRIDILGARQTIDLLNVVQSKTAGNITEEESRTLNTVLYELRMTFLELTRMISAPKPTVPPPGPKR